MSQQKLTGDFPTVTLVKYDAACRALAEARSIDEVKDIRDAAIAMAAYARQAKNRELEADAVEIRMRATRRLDQLRQAQKETVGLHEGGRPPKTGLSDNPVLPKPTLASQGIDKNLAHHARVLGALSEERFERAVSDARDATTRAFKTVVNAAAIEQERESYAARTEQGGTIADLQGATIADLQGGTIADLHNLVASGYRAGSISIDLPWPFRTYSEKGKQRSAERHYAVMSFDAMKALPVQALAAPDCALLFWAVWPDLKGAIEVIEAWGFEFKTVAFIWVKTTPSAECVSLRGGGLHWGLGYHTRANTEPYLLATRGAPPRLAADVHQVIIAPVGAHSEKPDEAYRRIERLYPGPYLELFARKRRDAWMCWGNEIASPLKAPPTSKPPLDSTTSATDDDGLSIPTFLRRASP